MENGLEEGGAHSLASINTNTWFESSCGARQRAGWLLLMKEGPHLHCIQQMTIDFRTKNKQSSARRHHDLYIYIYISSPPKKNRAFHLLQMPVFLPFPRAISVVWGFSVSPWNRSPKQPVGRCWASGHGASTFSRQGLSDGKANALAVDMA